MAAPSVGGQLKGLTLKAEAGKKVPVRSEAGGRVALGLFPAKHCRSKREIHGNVESKGPGLGEF